MGCMDTHTHTPHTNTHTHTHTQAAYDEARDSLSHSSEGGSEGEGEGDADRQDDAQLGRLKHQEIVMHHKVIEVSMYPPPHTESPATHTHMPPQRHCGETYYSVQKRPIRVSKETYYSDHKLIEVCRAQRLK